MLILRRRGFANGFFQACFRLKYLEGQWKRDVIYHTVGVDSDNAMLYFSWIADVAVGLRGALRR